MKKLVALICTAVIAMQLSGCCLSHEWAEATCTDPKTCTKCGKTEGEALGHDWEDATCITPKTCSVCGKTEGKALGHDWEDATCTAPKTCSVCGETEGEPVHDWEEATCTTPKTCKVCGETEGEALGHDWKNATPKSPKRCKRCGTTEGEPSEVVYFDKSFAEYMDGFNEEYKDYGISIVAGSGGFRVKSRDYNFSQKGSSNALFVFNDDDFSGVVTIYSEEKKEKFNILMLRYISTETTFNQDTADAINLIGCIMTKYLVDELPSTSFCDNLALSAGDYKNTCSQHGYDYCYEYIEPGYLHPNGWYEYSIKISANY